MKSYSLINVLNKEYGFFVNHVFFCFSYVVILLVSVNTSIAYSVAREFLLKDYKHAFRLGAWVIRKRFPSLDFVDDNFFDFTGNLKLHECKAYSDFIFSNRKDKDSIAFLTDELYILARRIHLSIEKSVVREDVDSLVAKFYELVQQCLSCIMIDSEPRSSNSDSGVDRVGDFSSTDAVIALRDFSELFPIESFPWYVVSGTFLGLHREGKFLSHDYDIDLGLNKENFDEDVVLQLLKNTKKFVVRKFDYHLEVERVSEGFVLKKSPALIKLVHKSGLNVDLFIHHQSGEYLWHGSVIHKWVNKKFGLEKRLLEGVRVYAPDNPDVYLTENYGKWNIPVKEFDCTTGTPNLVLARNFLSISLFIKKLLYFYEVDSYLFEKLKSALIRSELIYENENSQIVINDRFL